MRSKKQILSPTTNKLTDEELIKKYHRRAGLMHLAKTPLRKMLEPAEQRYIAGHNSGGRPEGLWIARGSIWMERIRIPDIDPKRYPMCCYLYQIVLKPTAKILHIKTAVDFKKFDKSFPNYWINLDYFDIQVTDRYTDKKIKSPRHMIIDTSKLKREDGDDWYTTLVKNKIIFETAVSAKKYSRFYRNCPIPVDRFRHKNWAFIAEKYQGIIFDNWGKDDSMKYLWFQTLDVNSGCIWDPAAIKTLKLVYHKIDPDHWTPVDSV